MERRGWTAERVALWLVVLLVAGGALDAGWRVAEGIGDRRIEYRGELDAEQILETHHPGLRARGGPRAFPAGYGYLSAGDGTITKPRAKGGLIAGWSVLQLAPWLLAALALWFLVPILRAADRGDPFRGSVSGRMASVGSLLLVALPLLEVFEYLLAEAAWGGVAPMVTPTVSISALHFLPGLLLLVLARIFAAGGELRDLERHTV